MYEKIKTVTFNDVEVTIYKNMHGEYFAEYRNGYRTEKVPCGTNYFDIWKVLQEKFQCSEYPDNEAMLNLADRIEDTLGFETTKTQIEAAVQRVLMEDDVIYPDFIPDVMLYILDHRFGRVTHDANVRIKLSPIASLEKWFFDAITSQRIYRLSTPDEYDEQHVRILGAHATPDNDYLMQFEILELTENKEGDWEITSGEVFMKLFSDCTLSHYKEDELPAKYQETEWE